MHIVVVEIQILTKKKKHCNGFSAFSIFSRRMVMVLVVLLLLCCRFSGTMWVCSDAREGALLGLPLGVADLMLGVFLFGRIVLWRRAENQEKQT